MQNVVILTMGTFIGKDWSDVPCTETPPPLWAVNDEGRIDWALMHWALQRF